MSAIYFQATSKRFASGTRLSGTKTKARKFRPIKILKSWYQNWRTRRELAGLSDYLLKDIGITRAEAEQEFSKPFWKE